jgi:hypothetical protein
MQGSNRTRRFLILSLCRLYLLFIFYFLTFTLLLFPGIKYSPPHISLSFLCLVLRNSSLPFYWSPTPLLFSVYILLHGISKISTQSVRLLHLSYLHFKKKKENRRSRLGNDRLTLDSILQLLSLNSVDNKSCGLSLLTSSSVRSLTFLFQECLVVSFKIFFCLKIYYFYF